MTREEAIAQGSKFYDGSPCKHGHNGKRYVLGKACMECRLAINKAYSRSHHKPAPEDKRPMALPTSMGYMPAPPLSRLMAGK